MLKLILLFAIIPATELYILISVGELIGVAPTVALVLLTAVAGATLARYQGLDTLTRIQESLRQGFMPAEDLLDGLLILLAGAVLLMPGFLTDLCGLLMLLPGTRNVFKRWLRSKFDEWRQGPNISIRFF